MGLFRSLLPPPPVPSPFHHGAPWPSPLPRRLVGSSEAVAGGASTIPTSPVEAAPLPLAACPSCPFCEAGGAAPPSGRVSRGSPPLLYSFLFSSRKASRLRRASALASSSFKSLHRADCRSVSPKSAYFLPLIASGKVVKDHSLFSMGNHRIGTCFFPTLFPDCSRQTFSPSTKRCEAHSGTRTCSSRGFLPT